MSNVSNLASTWLPRLEDFLLALRRFPWKNTALTMRERFRADHLALTASSLTFTTTIALVPLVTVALAIFTTFPVFAKFQGVLQQWLVESLIPEAIARQVLSYLTQFAGKASRLGGAGFAALLTSALALMLTIDHTLNSIWRVRRKRPLGRRVAVYWAAMTLGPLALGLSLSLTSYALSASRGVVSVLPGGVSLLLDVLQFGLLAWGLAALYHFVPNTAVRWRHAWAGGLFVSAGFELAKRLLVLYLGKVPTYSVLYGAFATLPILLIWIYVGWAIVLLGAVIAAYLPSLLAGVPRRARAHGWHFLLAVEVAQQLQRARQADSKGLSAQQLAVALQVDPLQLVPVLEALTELDWIGLLQEDAPAAGARWLLLAQPQSTPLAPLLERLLLQREENTQHFWISSQWTSLTLADVL